MLETPRFHHLHLRSVDPEAAIDWYTRQFTTTSRTSWGDHPALRSPNDVLIVFEKVDAPAPKLPQSAIWHFGWHVPDARAYLETYKARPEVRLLPLYTTDEGDSVLISSDTWPNIGNAIGLTKAQIDEARAKRLQPPGGGGFTYFTGPDDALIEIAGDYPAERFNHVHMWHQDPICALLWYQRHLNAPVRPGFEASALTEASCRVERTPDRTWPALNREGMFRAPRAGVEFGDVVLTWYPNQGDEPLVSSRGQFQDHIGLSVTDLDTWIAKLRDGGVRFLADPYEIAGTRGVMIEGPSREAIALVEV